MPQDNGMTAPKPTPARMEALRWFADHPGVILIDHDDTPSDVMVARMMRDGDIEFADEYPAFYDHTIVPLRLTPAGRRRLNGEDDRGDTSNIARANRLAKGGKECGPGPKSRTDRPKGRALRSRGSDGSLTRKINGRTVRREETT